MYYTIYKITNQIDGKIYIGSHKTKNLDDNYMGSGKYLKYAQEKYGIENFTKEILFVFDTPEAMYAKEAEIVNEDFLAMENTYNLKIGGFGGWDYLNSDYNKMMQRNKNGRKAANKAILELYGVEYPSQIERNRIKRSLLNKKMHEEGKFDHIPRDNFRGKYHTDETKRKIGLTNSLKQQGSNNSQFGTMWITDGVSNTKINKTDPIPEGWRKGRVYK